MKTNTVPNIKKDHLEKAMAELEELDKEIASKSRRRDELRTKMADIFHTGEDGTQNTEIHDVEVKVVRRLSVKCEKDAQEQLKEDKPELYKKVYQKKASVVFNSTEAKKNLDELEDYVTTKQGLPTVTFKRIG